MLAWITEGGWEACVDAARAYEDVTLLQVSDVGPPEPGGLLGRHRPPHAPVAADDELLDAARERLGREADVLSPSGKPEHAVVDAADDFDLLILSRTNLRPGPHSIGHAHPLRRRPRALPDPAGLARRAGNRRTAAGVGLV